MEGQQKHVAIKYFISDDCKIKYFFHYQNNLPESPAWVLQIQQESGGNL